MRKNFLLTLFCLFALGMSAFAQDSLRITYDATKGDGGPGGALTPGGYAGTTSALLHSGPAPAATDWCAAVGTWGDPSSEIIMSSVGTDLWEATVHVDDYYGPTVIANACDPFDFIGLVVADTTFTIEGKGPGESDIFIDISDKPNPPAVSAGKDADNAPFDGVTAEWVMGVGIPTFDHAEIQLTSFPNPFVENVNFTYTLKRSAEVSLTIYDAMGRVVELMEQSQMAGSQSIKWNAEKFESGMYIYRLEVGEKSYAGSLMHF